ncbi:putative nitroreductase [Cystobasidiomycetes sp. EMM_F5]
MNTIVDAVTAATSSAPSSAAFFKAVEGRRTYYGIKNESPISDEKLRSLVYEAVKHTPSAFNMQTSRAVIFLHDSSIKVWDVVAEEFLKTLGGDEDQIKTNKGKIEGYKSGYGTIAFFEDQDVLKGWCSKMPHFSEAFNTWSGNSTGMLQYVVWTALEAEGFGASLQHHFSYSQAIPPAVSKAFSNIPESWKCTALMPFGLPAGPAGTGHPKTFDKLDERVLVL